MMLLTTDLKRWLVVGVLAASALGCTQRVRYSDLGTWNGDVKVLGPVNACQGGFCCPEGRCQWPMALTVPPPAETYHRALVDDAVSRYHVAAEDVVLHQVVVTLSTEVVGTVRGWAAEAIAGTKPSPPSPQAQGDTKTKAGTIEDRLRNLKALHDQGLITDEVFHRRQAAILEEL